MWFCLELWRRTKKRSFLWSDSFAFSGNLQGCDDVCTFTKFFLKLLTYLVRIDKDVFSLICWKLKSTKIPKLNKLLATFLNLCKELMFHIFSYPLLFWRMFVEVNFDLNKFAIIVWAESKILIVCQQMGFVLHFCLSRKISWSITVGLRTKRNGRLTRRFSTKRKSFSKT